MSSIAFGATARFNDWAAGLPVQFSSGDSPKHLIKAVAQSAQKRSATSGVDVEDLFQVGMVALWKAADVFDSSRGEYFDNLTRRAAVNAMNNEIRAEASHVNNRVWGDSTSNGLDIEDDEFSIERLADQNCEFDERTSDQPFALMFDSQVQALLDSSQAQLTHNQRQILTLRYSCDYTMEEIGQRLDMTQQNVSKLHRKALDHLREILDAVLH